VNTPSTQSLTLTATGSAVTVSGATASGTGFSVSGATFPMTVNPGASATLNVQFNPTAAGAASGNLTIANNSSNNSSASIALSGTGVTHQIALNWTAPSDNSDPVAGYRVYRATSGSSSYALLNSSATSQTTYTDATAASGTSYQYYVTSVDSAGSESTPSNTATVAVP
jgi:Abnormal spindle-like microcephaly-assoc'd, ASPM-SPD-2-Hydin